MDVLIVDGYNVINAWQELAELAEDNLESSRLRLLDYLSNYQGYKKNRVIVVFDAHMVASNTKHYMHDDVEVVFTREGQTADNYIERIVRELSKSNMVRVATSDFLEQTLILGGGATRLSSRELINELELQNKVIEDINFSDRMKKNDVESNISPQIREFLDKLRRKE